VPEKGTVPCGESIVPLMRLPATVPFTMISIVEPPYSAVDENVKPSDVTLPSLIGEVPSWVCIVPVRIPACCVNAIVPVTV
jgi:hypothetical protein